MTKEELQTLLDAEMRLWSTKSLETIVSELGDREQAYDREYPIGWHQFEIMLLENTSDYIHIGVSVDDGSKEWACTPLSSSFLMYRDGRIDI